MKTITALKSNTCFIIIFLLGFRISAQDYKIIGTDVSSCYDNNTIINCPTDSKAPFYGQFQGKYPPSYRNNGDGTVSDLVTDLMWQSNPDINGNNDGSMHKSDKLTWPQIQARINSLNSSKFAGYDDWRIPTIKELYSLTNWNGTDPSGYQGSNTGILTPFINTQFFPFSYGQTSEGERIIDVQYASGIIYKELSFNGSQKLFGFNFADGRIKGYDLKMPDGTAKVFSFIAVRGNPKYGTNEFVDNGDNTITDKSTGLMWTKDDSKTGMNWEDALRYAQTKNSGNYCGHNDWRLPNAKELQSIVDYSRSPGSTNSAAINPLFNCSGITNESGQPDFPWFWTSTTHRSYNGVSYGGGWAVYICFGRAAGWMRLIPNNYYSYVDVHGAGAQRSSPKSGNFLGDYLGTDVNGKAVYGLGPQGDLLRINNYVRLVRDVKDTLTGSLPDIPLIRINGSATICEGDSVHLFVKKQSGVHYQWMSGKTNVGGDTSDFYAHFIGNYTCQISNKYGSVMSSNTITVQVQRKPLHVSITLAGDSVFCKGDSSLLSVPLEAGVSYQWFKGKDKVGLDNNNFKVTESGSYTVELSDSCGTTPSDNQINITVSSVPATPTIIRTGGDTLTCNVQAEYYLWYFNGSKTNYSTQSIVPADEGNYTVKISDAGCLSAESQPFEFTRLGVNEEISSDQKVIAIFVEDGFPVPGNSTDRYEIYSIYGAKVSEGFCNESIRADVLCTGLYLLKTKSYCIVILKK